MGISEDMIQNLYDEIKSLREEISALRNLIIPTLQLSAKESNELDTITNEMEKGDEVDYQSLIVD